MEATHPIRAMGGEGVFVAMGVKPYIQGSPICMYV